MATGVVRKIPLYVEDSTFTNEHGEVVPYNKLYCEIEGERFRVLIQKEDKRMFNHMVKKVVGK